MSDQEYIRKDRLKAFRWGYTDVWPQWFREWAMTHSEDWAIAGSPPKSEFRLKTPACTAVALYGDYITMDADGEVFPVSYETFHQLYLPVVTKPETVSVATQARAEIFAAVDKERKAQDAKWGPDFDAKNTANDWVTYIGHQCAKATPFAMDHDAFVQRMINIAAIAVAAVETVRNNNGKLPRRHYDLLPL